MADNEEIVIIPRGEPIRDEEGRITGYERGKQKVRMKVDPSRRAIYTSGGKVYTSRRKRTEEGRILIEPKKKEEYIREAISKVDKAKQKRHAARLREEERKRTQQNQTLDPNQAFSPISESTRQEMLRVASERKKKRFFKARRYEASPEKTISQKLLARAKRLDKEQDVFKSLEATGTATAAAATGALFSIGEFFTGDVESAKKDIKITGEVLFPSLDQATIYRQSGVTSAGIIIQELAGGLVGKVVSRGANLLRRTFGAKTVVSKARGTGTTLINQEKQVGQGIFTQRRVLVTPVGEAKKSRVIIQDIRTVSTSGTGKSKDVAKGLADRLTTRSNDLITATTNKGKIKTVFTPETTSRTVSTIKSYDLAGKRVAKDITVKTYGVQLKGSNKTLRLIKTYQEGELTKAAAVLTKKRTIKETSRLAKPARILTQEKTIGLGIKQKVTFAEKTVVKQSQVRYSTGALSNALENVNVLKPSAPKIRTPEPATSIANLPLTLDAGISFRVPKRLPSPTGLRLGEITIPSYKEKSLIEQEQSFRVFTDTKSLFRTVSENTGRTEPEQMFVDLPKIRDKTKRKPTIDIGEKTGIVPKQSAKSRLKVPTKTITTPDVVPKTPIRPPLRPKVPLFVGGINKGVRKKSSFQVFVRVKGEWKKIGGSLTKSRAFELGKTYVGQRSAASFKVLGKGGQPVTSGFGLGNMFRKSKREKGVFVEKRKFRINFPTELSEITFKSRMRFSKK